MHCVKGSLFLCFILLGCGQSKSKPELGPGVLKYTGRESIQPGTEPKIQIENLDGSIFKELDVLNDTSIISDFYPLVLFLEDDLLVFEVVGIKNQIYSIKIFDNKGEMIKKINLEKNKTLKFMSWEDYFLTTDVLLDVPKSIQVYKEPHEHAGHVTKKLTGEVDELAIKEIKGYWMKLELIYFSNDQSDAKEVLTGWIKWRNKSELLFEIGFFGD